MTIIGYSKAALAMIFDAMVHKRTDFKFFIYNNLNLDFKFSYPGFSISEIKTLTDNQYILGAVTPETKRKLVEKFDRLNYIRVRNPKCSVSENVTIYDGVMIDAGVSVASGVTLGKFVTLYSNCSVAHDCQIGEFVTICPNVAVCGSVKIGEGSFIGAGSVIMNDITIGKNCIIGCGSVVIRDVPDGKTVYGNPAHK